LTLDVSRRDKSRDLSDAQANAEALARRDQPYRLRSEASTVRSFDYRTRQPADLRDAVRLARRAYTDEVPEKLHDGADAIGVDGTPRMSARAVSYIFGAANASDARYDPETGEPTEFVSYYHAPFRATLAQMAVGDDSSRRRARIVSHVTIGSQSPYDAALSEGAHPLDAKLVAYDALVSFLRSLSDLRIHVPRRDNGLDETP
jgi:hypothetical protein